MKRVGDEVKRFEKVERIEVHGRVNGGFGLTLTRRTDVSGSAPAKIAGSFPEPRDRSTVNYYLCRSNMLT